MLQFQRRIVCFWLVACLLAASLGLGCGKLCVRGDGQLLFNAKCGPAQPCTSHRVVRIATGCGGITVSGPVSGCACSPSQSCFQVPLVMITAGRGSSRLLVAGPDDPATHSSLLLHSAPHGAEKWTDKSLPSDLPSSSSVESILRFSVLLI